MRASASRRVSDFTTGILISLQLNGDEETRMELCAGRQQWHSVVTALCVQTCTKRINNNNKKINFLHSENNVE